jgi:pimeloyl-ACP methyl ester carboxylesterase
VSGVAKLSGLFFVLGCAGSVPAPAIEDDSVYLHPGVRVPAGDGVTLNLYCTGSGTPAVVFDSGHQDWAPAWSTVQPRVAQWTRTCSYDRAGSGFSSAGPMPRTSTRIADELHDALHNAGIRGPYISVGRAFGSVNMQTYADRAAAQEWTGGSRAPVCRKGVGPAGFSCGAGILLVRYRAAPRGDSQRIAGRTQEARVGALIWISA